MGYYSGLGSRKLDSLTLAVSPQPASQVDALSYAVTCPWSGIPYSLSQAWVTGVYVVKITLTSSSFVGKQSYMTFVLRDDSRTAPLLYQVADNTWQAYNDFGGYSCYSSPLATAVSFDRPYAEYGDVLADHQGFGHDYGSGQFFTFEYGNIQFIEANGYDVQYVSTFDVDETAGLLLGRSAVISGGHDEYWSRNMFQAYEQARDNEVNLLFLGANQAYWDVQYDAAHRRELLNKLANPMPYFREEGTPEWHLFGSQSYLVLQTPFIGFHERGGYLLGSNPSGFPVTSNWVFDGTFSEGIQDGARIGGVVYGEFNDKGDGDASSMPYLSQVSYLGSWSAENDRTECSSPTMLGCHARLASYYAPLSSARVFTTGTFGWNNALYPRNDRVGANRAKAVTKSVLDNFVGADTWDRVIPLSGDFNGDGRTDMGGIYDTGNDGVRIRVRAP
jgi:hypothetical protein